MPKQKTHKGAAKRFKISGGGKVMRQQTGHQHIATKKTTKRKRKLRKQTTSTGAMGRNVKEMLHN